MTERWPKWPKWPKWPNGGQNGRNITFVVIQLGKKSKHCSYYITRARSTGTFFLEKFQMVVKKIDRRTWIKFLFQVPDLRNLKPEIKYAMKILTQFVMKLERKSLHFNFNDFVTSRMKTNFTHESDA